MAQIRRNIITGEYVSISESRKNRPMSGFQKENYVCPFCPENRIMTPDELFVSESGRVRIFPNLYPILDGSDSSGYGIHEIVVDTDIHDEYFHDFSQKHAEEALSSIIGRLPVMYKNEKIKYVQVFKNQGRNSGATIAHSHWQIIGTPFLPLYQEILQKNSRIYFEETGKCYICEVIKDKGQIVYENEGAVAFCPKEAKFGFEIDVAPKKHFAGVEEADGKQISFIADALKKSSKAIYSEISEDYNICFQNLTFKNLHYLHFYIQVIPRLGRFGGFELSTSSFTHSEYPEKSAKILQKTIANI